MRLVALTLESSRASIFNLEIFLIRGLDFPHLSIATCSCSRVKLMFSVSSRSVLLGQQENTTGRKAEVDFVTKSVSRKNSDSVFRGQDVSLEM